jgi:tetratricopeptide (TPR) repeat protein
MLWFVLRTFLAWGSARLIKKFLFKTDFGRPIAIVLAIIWGIVWGIAAAFAFEYIFGEGNFNNKTLVPSIIFTSFAAYYAFIANDFKDNSVESTLAHVVNPETQSLPSQENNKFEAPVPKIVQKSFFLNLKVTTALLIIAAIILFFLISVGKTDNPLSELSVMYRNLKFEDKSSSTDDFENAMLLFNSNKFVDAKKLLEPIAMSGDARAQFTLALIYSSGNGVKEDHKQAADWCKKAAEQGLPEAQGLLGMMYETGIGGITQNYEQAVEWYKKAAIQQNAQAQSSLGKLYYLGMGVTQDYGEAITWFRKSAKQGNVAAQSYLGWMYGNGEGVTQDFIHSHMWANLAGASGEDSSIKLRDILAKKMTGYQIAEAQKLASECKKSNYKSCN